MGCSRSAVCLSCVVHWFRCPWLDCVVGGGQSLRTLRVREKSSRGVEQAEGKAGRGAEGEEGGGSAKGQAEGQRGHAGDTGKASDGSR